MIELIELIVCLPIEAVEIWQKSNRISNKYNIPKNQVIENALAIYPDQLKRAEYAQSYSQAGKDEEVMLMAEERMEEYMIILSSRTKNKSSD